MANLLFLQVDKLAHQGIILHVWSKHSQTRGEASPNEARVSQCISEVMPG